MNNPEEKSDKELLDEFFRLPEQIPRKGALGSSEMWMGSEEATLFYKNLPAEIQVAGHMSGHLQVRGVPQLARHRKPHHVTKVFKELYDRDPEMLLRALEMGRTMNE